MINFKDFSFFLALLPLVFSSIAKAELVERLYAIVNKKAIYKSDVTRFKKLMPLRAKIDPIFAADPMAKKPNPDDSLVVNYLIDELLITEKFQTTDSEVEQEVNGIQSNLRIDRDGLKAALAREGFKFEDYFALMRASVSKRQLIDREIRSKAAVSEDDVRAEYNRAQASSKKFRGSFHLRLIKITKKNYKSQNAARDMALKVASGLKAGESFESLASSHSDDSSQSAQGELGYLAYSEMTPLLQREVQKLGPEKTSELIEDNQAYYFIKVGDIRADVDPEFEKEKDQYRGKLMEAEFHHQIKLWLDRQRSLNYIKNNLSV